MSKGMYFDRWMPQQLQQPQYGMPIEQGSVAQGASWMGLFQDPRFLAALLGRMGAALNPKGPLAAGGLVAGDAAVAALQQEALKQQAQGASAAGGALQVPRNQPAAVPATPEIPAPVSGDMSTSSKPIATPTAEIDERLPRLDLEKSKGLGRLLNAAAAFNSDDLGEKPFNTGMSKYFSGE